MNPPRRTLEAALLTPEVTPEALAIIEGGKPKPASAVSPVIATSTQKLPATAQLPRVTTQAVKLKPEKERGPEPSFVSMTVRVPASIPPTLLKASSERKMKKIRPYTQQDIVAEALTGWLQKNGYLG
jgi:hypothetical protein